MKRKFSIYHFLVALMLSTLILPGFASAGQKGDSSVEGTEGSLTIHKFEQDPIKGQEPGEAGDGSKLDPNPVGEPLEGVEFTLTQTHKYNPNTDKWTAVTGDPKTYKKTTGSDGKIVINDIELGRYEVKETDGPPYVNLNTNIYHVDIPMTNAEGTEVNYNVHIYPKNETIRGAVELTKVDGATCPEQEVQPRSSISGKKDDKCEGLEGVTFNLYDSDGELVSEGHTTDENGKIRVSGLAYGSYTLVEVSTVDGYVLGGEVTFFISESGSIDEAGERDGTVKEVTAYNYSEPGVEKDVDSTAVNRGEIVTYTITVDLPADIKDYKSFVVTDELHENLEYISHEDVAGFAFSKNGQTLTWTGIPAELEPGTAEISFTAKVKKDAKANEDIDNKATIDYENKHGTDGNKETDPVTVTPTAGSLKIIKQDGNNKKTKLEGAEFDLMRDGEVVKSGKTDSNGVIYFGELDYGEYQLVETKAPNGYNKLRNPIDITIDKDHHKETIKVNNYKSGWQLPKTGGIGTMLFTFIGLSLMGGASFMFARRRNGEQA